MLFPFVSTRPRYTAHPVVLLLSITAHFVLITFACAPRPARSRTASGDVARDDPVSIERIRYVTVAPPRESAPPSAPTKPQVAAPVFTQVRAASIDHIAVAEAVPVPTIDLRSRVNDVDSAAGPVARVTELVRGIVATPSVGAHNGPYDKTEVDRIVSPFTNNPKPIYPRRMERDGVETSFIAQFVVDSTGRVDEATMLFPPTVHPLFIDAVRESLRRARFHPAEVGGKRVPQLVEQQFTFVLIQGGSR
jgi:TonB family protein